MENRNDSKVMENETEDVMESLNDILDKMVDLDIKADLHDDSSSMKNIPAAISAALQNMVTVVLTIKDCEILQILIKSIPVIKTIYNIVSYLPKISPVLLKILSLFGNGRGNNDVGVIVRHSIDNALEDYDDVHIRTEAEACVYSFQHTQQYLRGLQSTELITESDIHALQPRNMAEKKDEFICELRIRIESLFKVYDSSADKDSKTARKVLAYLQLYCQLVVVKQIILWYLVCIIQRASVQLDATIAAIKNVLTCYRNDANRLIAKLAHPNEKTTVILATFDPAEMPFLHKYMTDLNIYQNLDYLKNRPVAMTTQRWPEYFAVRLLHSKGLPKFKRYVRGMNDSTSVNESHFVFEKAEDGNYFTIRLDHDTRTVYLHVDPDKNHWIVGLDRIQGLHRVPEIGDSLTLRVWGVAGAPGKDCVFKIIRLPDGSHLISPRQWPRYFIAMSRKFHKCLHGVLNDQGQRSPWEFD